MYDCGTSQLPPFLFLKMHFYFQFFLFFVFFMGSCEGGGWIWRDGEMGGLEVHDMKFTKNQ